MLNFFKQPPSISMNELRGMVSNNAYILDVRTPEEFRGGHIQGSKNFPLDRIHSFSQKLNEPIYVVCQSGMRSKRATKMLIKKGYEAINVKGGLLSWSGKLVQGGK